ncbi:MAG: ribosome maturation factor RimM [Holosporaceae bacterium]|nr:ribosome maturation factor RimM [Holosporaceae bacterium]
MIEILRVIGTFGIRGALRVFSFSKNLSYYHRIYDKNHREFVFRVIKFCGNNKVIIHVDDIADKSTAESLKGEIFYIKKSDLPEIEKNEVYLCDLIGKEVSVLDSDVICRIVDAKNFSAGDLIEISYENTVFLVPFTTENFPNIDNRICMTLEAFNGFKN